MSSDLKEFMERVVPWPADGEEGWINLHWKLPNPHDAAKPDIWAGKPVKNITEFLSLLEWVLARNNTKDIYFCLSRQAKSARNTKGNIIAARHADDAVCLNAIWIDLDVKAPPKGYATMADALDALTAFRKAAGLPAPSAIVHSGGGLHVYWISLVPLQRDEWQLYANGLKVAAINFGLKCDIGCTIDSARVLRVPGTFNYKQLPLRPVVVKGFGPSYDFPVAFAALKALAPTPLITPSSASSAPFDLSRFPLRVPSGPIESLAEGLGRGPMPPLDIGPLIQKAGCGFLREAFITGGKDYDQPQWNITTLLNTFIENGKWLAHKMGCQHPGYSRESTGALWDRKIGERKSRNLGWPSCSAIQAAGSKACAACPHLGKIKSPLNLTAPATPADTASGDGGGVATSAGQAAVGPAGLITAAVTPGAEISLPSGFVLNSAGLICKVTKGSATAAPETICVFTSKLTKAWAQAKPVALNFITTMDKDAPTKECSLLHTIIQGGSTPLFIALAEEGVMVHPPGKQYVEEFLMAWLTKIRNAQKSLQALPFGWWCSDDKSLAKTTGNRHGFVFGGLLFKDDKTVHKSGHGDQKTRENYEPTGDIQPWLDACKVSTDQKRPELDCIVAAAFAAPLMAIPAKSSALMSIWGTSGSGKSAAVDVGLAVWGHPKRTKCVSMSTAKAVLNLMGETKNLPLYWDEISEEGTQEHVFNTYFNSTHGIEGARMTSQVKQRDRAEWQTMMVMCANVSFVDFVAKKLKTSSGGIYRVMEAELKDGKEVFGYGNVPGQIDQLDASRITQELETNHGHMGIRYARLLGRSPAKIDAWVLKICQGFSTEVNAFKEERYWTALCGTMIAGATLANTIGATLDVPAMRQFLIKTFLANRKRLREEAVEGGTVTNTMEAMSDFFKAYISETIWTDTFPMGKGKPKAITVLQGPPTNYPRPIQLQWAVGERTLRICKREFMSHLDHNKIPPRSVINGLTEHFGASFGYAKIAAGTQYQCIQEQLIIVPVPPGSPFEDQLLAHSNTVDIGAAAAVALSEESDVPSDLLLGAASAQAAADLSLVRNKT